MCLAVPGKILTIFGEETLFRRGRVSFAGVVKDICLVYVPDARVDDYVIVHAGFAIHQLDERQARISLDELEALGNLERERPS